ncbi:hypothetical protein [Streptococcus iners]|uniref:Uncharacterized protein n=1 Tax=Streptococcus iners subsp. hyiners TaxID=3028083 RepID=A0AA96VJ10_9STRE|nr:hypothetical protein [Streptococcus sp. 29892]MCK4030528.1 hypothetical protein [Streptococcus suis]NQI71570.1 hypothetical protein [Streptococcus suis]WNY49231.1 hypothetical protein PW220_00885 [Streptococcus sp. 29892]
MKKFLNLHPKFIRFVFLLVAVLTCLSFAYSRYEDYRLTPRISEEVKNAPLKIDTSSIMLEDNKPYRLPENIGDLVGVYKGNDDGKEIQVRVNPDGTYEKISRGNKTTETYLDSNGVIRFSEGETVQLEIGYLVKEHAYIHFYLYSNDILDAGTFLGLKLLSDGLYMDSSGNIDILKSMFQKIRRETIFQNNEVIPQDVLMIDESNATFRRDFLLFDEEKLVNYSRYHGGSNKGGWRESYIPKYELIKSTEVYDIWAQPIEKWAIEEVLIEEVTLSDFLQMYGSSIRKTAKGLWQIANNKVTDPTDTELETYIKENGRALTDEELAHIKKKYGVEFDVSFGIENKGYFTTINVFGWSEDTGFDEFGLLKENGRF